MLVDGWNNVLSLLGSGGAAVLTVLAVIGVLIVIFSIGGWMWQRRKGAATMGGFPWMAVIVGALLAGPKVIAPLLLGIIDIIINLGSYVVTWVVGRF